jgi:hypothetical protein
MMAKPTHTIDEALKNFDLISGAGSEDSKEACAMTLLAWVAGREWTDRPPCAHRLIRNEVVQVNDASGTTKAMRTAIVKAGETGILDTWWITDQVIVWAFATPKGQKRSTSRYKLLLAALERISAWKLDKGLPPTLCEADLSGANLSGANLSAANLYGANLYRANLYRAIGTPLGRMLPGWALDDAGLWMKS